MLTLSQTKDMKGYHGTVGTPTNMYDYRGMPLFVGDVVCLTTYGDDGKKQDDYDKRPELDRWILSKYNRLVADVTENMDQYDHMKTVRAITDFVAEDLSNWYIRRARRIFYAEEMTEDKKR